LSEIQTQEPAAIPAKPVPPGCELIGGNLWMFNGKGHLVRRENVSAVDQLQDEVVRKIMGYAEELSAQVARFKQHTLKDIGDFIGLIAQDYGDVRGGVKGNISLYSFDQTLRIDLAVADRIEFGPQLHSAKALVDECLMEWSAESNAALQTIVQGAFNVDQKGRISPAALFTLLRYDVADERWQRAMTAIRDSIRPVGT
jgi:hypothetical protein